LVLLFEHSMEHHELLSVHLCLLQEDLEALEQVQKEVVGEQQVVQLVDLVGVVADSVLEVVAVVVVVLRLVSGETLGT